MKFSADDNGLHPIVQAQYRCVWMTAGILSYQLCDRTLDCDNCPLDKAMRMHFGGKHTTDKISPAEKLSSSPRNLPGYLYSRNHCWITFPAEHVARIGIEPMLAALLISPKETVLPSPGEPIEYDHFSCWIILEGGAYPLTSPISGITLRTNPLLANDSYVICTQPLTNGWLFEADIEPEKLRTFHLMTKEEARGKYEMDFSHFNRLLSTAHGVKNINMGTTLQDGGQLVQNLGPFSESGTYLQILMEAFCSTSH